jgi:hypothetical protein
MSVMDIIRKWKERNSEKSEKFKEMQEDDRLRQMLEERKKSSNQRELEKYYKEQQEKQIKEELDLIRKKQTKESWKGKNMFAGKGTILKEDKSILTDNKKLLNNKGSILNSSSMVRQEMFFKW